jgi:DNA ligase-1
VTLFAELVRASQRVGASAARKVKVRELSSFLRALGQAEIETGVHYLSGEIPQGKIGVGFAAVRAAASTEAADTETLLIAEVDQRLTELAVIRGAGSAARRAAALKELFSRATAIEQQFLLRLLIGELRQGALSGIMVDVIAAAAELPVPEVRRAAMYAKGLGAVAQAALRGGAAGTAALAAFQLELFSPVSPMLAQTAADVGEALKEIREAAFEWKMDGARIQVHKSGDEVRIYTRSLNEISAAIPEIAELARSFQERALVLDGEAIAFDSSGRPHPFQVTMKRFGRKLNVEASRSALPIQAFFFDCLRVGDESIASSPTQERFEALAKAVPAPLLVPRLITSSEPQARAFYDAAIAAGHEGVMAKALDAP